MRARSPILAICAVAALPLLGCDRMKSAGDTASREAPASEVAQIAIGELASVNGDSKTFVVRGDDGIEHSFRYTEATEVAAGSSAQGLAGREGDRVRVSYHAMPNTDTTAPVVNEAVRIEVVTPEQR
jgi:hypothetical protein